MVKVYDLGCQSSGYYEKAKFILITYILVESTNLLLLAEAYYKEKVESDGDKRGHIYACMEPLDKTLKEYVQEKYAENGDGIDKNVNWLLVIY